MLSLRNAYTVLLPLGLVLFSTAWVCGGSVDYDRWADEHFHENFLRAIATADEDGYDIYWLGREFEAVGLTFRGPKMPDWGGTYPGGGIGMTYGAIAPEDDPRRFITVSMSLYSPAAWERVAESVLNRPNLQGEQRSIRVNGRDAELFITGAGTRPVNSVRVYVFYPGTTVVVSTNSLGPGPDGGEINALLDDEIFLSIVEKIRPYPE